MRFLQALFFFFVFISLGTYFFFDEFQSFRDQKKQEEESFYQLQREIGSFSLDDLKSFSGVTLSSLPDKQFINILLKSIENAEENIDLNVYIFTEKRIRSALIKAKKRGIPVRVILEKNVYKAPSLNKETFMELEKNGISIKYDNTPGIDLNHAKYIIIDRQVFFATGNFTYTSFSKNREFFLFSSHPHIVQFFKRIFDADFLSQEFYVYNSNMLVSPRYSREKIEYLLNSAQKSIDMYIPYLEDESVKRILLQKQLQGISLRIITNKSEIENPFFTDIQKNGVELIFSKTNIHAKSILVDKKFLYIGSINFSAPSMDENREVGMILIEKEIISQFEKIFKSDL